MMFGPKVGVDGEAMGDIAAGAMNVKGAQLPSIMPGFTWHDTGDTSKEALCPVSS